MPLQKLALSLTLSVLCFGCHFRFSRSHSEQAQASISQPILTGPLKRAIEEVRVMKVKIERDSGVNPKEYDENLTALENIVDKAYGDSKTVAAVKSIVEGHELALQFLRCDRMEGYDDMHQCRDQALKKIFVKYPDLAAAAKEAVEGEALPFISAGLDKDAILQAIWQETAKDTDAVLLALNLEPHPPESQPQQ